MAEPIDRFIACADRMSTCSTSRAKLKSKKLNYCGEVIEHMEDIVAEKVIKAWPTPGNAAVVDLKTCLPDDLAAELDDLHSFLLPTSQGRGLQGSGQSDVPWRRSWAVSGVLPSRRVTRRTAAPLRGTGAPEAIPWTNSGWTFPIAPADLVFGH